MSAQDVLVGLASLVGVLALAISGWEVWAKLTGRPTITRLVRNSPLRWPAVVGVGLVFGVGGLLLAVHFAGYL